MKVCPLSHPSALHTIFACLERASRVLGGELLDIGI